ncbi:OmpW/AlkL family protein [Arhodomonas sp. SL1]|uniref:OmpW/AlkL family protein n=1 Tax=Arhodomonas sp. SL1 TaxID=3425691 RepID=UPI003F880C1C
MERALKLSTLAAAGVLAATLAAPVAAADAGDWIVRGGLSLVDPDDDSSNPGGALAGTNAGVNVDSDTRPSFTVSYFMTDNVAVELLGAFPFEHDIEGTGMLDGVDVGSTKHLPPTLSLQYHFDTGTQFRPYAGIGVNYTRFFDKDVDGDTKALGFTRLDLDDSWGLAGQVGVDYELGNRWLLNADIRYIDIDTDATLKGPGDARATMDVDIDPWVYTLGVGYRF